MEKLKLTRQQPKKIKVPYRMLSIRALFLQSSGTSDSISTA